MRRKKQKSSTGTEHQMQKRKQRRKRKTFFRWICSWFNSPTPPSEEDIKEEFPLFI